MVEVITLPAVLSVLVLVRVILLVVTLVNANACVCIVSECRSYIHNINVINHSVMYVSIGHGAFVYQIYSLALYVMQDFNG